MIADCDRTNKSYSSTEPPAHPAKCITRENGCVHITPRRPTGKYHTFIMKVLFIIVLRADKQQNANGRRTIKVPLVPKLHIRLLHYASNCKPFLATSIVIKEFPKKNRYGPRYTYFSVCYCDKSIKRCKNEIGVQQLLSFFLFRNISAYYYAIVMFERRVLLLIRNTK